MAAVVAAADLTETKTKQPDGPVATAADPANVNIEEGGRDTTDDGGGGAPPLAEYAWKAYPTTDEASKANRPWIAKEDSCRWVGFQGRADDNEDLTRELELRQRAAVCRGACTLFLCLGFLAGVVCWIVAGAEMAGESVWRRLERAGQGLMIAFGVLVCLVCCSSCARARADSLSGPAKRRQKYEFVRLNNRYAGCSENLDDALRRSERALPKAARRLLKEKEAERKKAEREKDHGKKREDDVVQKIKSFFEEGLTPRQVAAALRPCVFVIDFDGDVNASQVKELRKLVDVLKEVADPRSDEVVVRLTSPGGLVTSYGLASVQLMRLREAGIRLTVCVDLIAASGGYMMACVANRVVASPFSVIGSVGVVAYIPNFQRLLEKHDVDMHLFTAGKHKRTVDVVGPVTDEGKAKMQEELVRIHGLFKNHIGRHRPQIRDHMDEIATGEAWSGEEALGIGLVDEISSSDEYLARKMAHHDVIRVRKKKAPDNSLMKWVAGESNEVLLRFARGVVDPARRAMTRTLGVFNPANPSRLRGLFAAATGAAAAGWGAGAGAMAAAAAAAAGGGGSAFRRGHSSGGGRDGGSGMFGHHAHVV